MTTILGRNIMDDINQIQQRTTAKLNTNSYISISLMVIIIGCAIWISNSFKDFSYRLETIEKKTTENIWTSVDMFKWAVKLQQTNPQIKVPEPKHEKDE